MAALCASIAATTFAAADTSYLSDYRYIDGATAHAETVCATADLCGTVLLRSGDYISIYAEEVLGCELPTLHIVRRRGTALVISYQLNLSASTGHRQAAAVSRPSALNCQSSAYVNFDKGKIRMAVFPLSTGNQVFVRFAAGTSQERTNSTPAIIKAR